MTTKILAVLGLALVLGACESASPDETKPAPTPSVQASADQSATPSPAAVATVPAAFKAGDRVKMTINGAAAEVTIVSVDEKAATATVKVQGEAKERTVSLSEIVKQ